MKVLDVGAFQPPQARAGHAAVAIDDKRFIVHGGYSDEGIFNDFWLFDSCAPRFDGYMLLF